MAEQEITLVLQTLRPIARHIGLKEGLSKTEAKNLARRTNVNAMMRSLEEEPPKD